MDGRDDDGEKKEFDARWCGNTEPKGIVFDESRKEEEETDALGWNVVPASTNENGN